MVRRTAYGVLPVLVALGWVLGPVLAAGGAGAATASAADQAVQADQADPTGPVGLGGTPVEASSDPSDPTPLTAGLWADTLSGPGAAPGNAHWFRYDRTMQFGSVLVGAVATSPEPSGDALEVEVSVDGQPCGSDSTSASGADPAATFGVLVVVPDDEPGDTADPCVRSDHVDIRLSRGSADLASDLPVAVRVVEEAPVPGAGDDPVTPVEEPTVAPPTPGEPDPVSGGRTFDQAPDLTAGGTVSDAVPEGAERLYRVRLGWGQELAAQVDLPAQDDATAETLGGALPRVELTLLDPLRNPFDTGHPDAETTTSWADEPARLFDGTRPVDLANRFDDGLVSVPGDYWVSVSVSPPYDEDRAPVDVPVELTVAVTGTGGDAPDFQEVVLSPAGGAGPDGYDPATPYLVADGVFSADVSGTPRAPGGGSTGPDGVRRVAGLVVGAAGLVSLLAGLGLLGRRARVSRAAAR